MTINSEGLSLGVYTRERETKNTYRYQKYDPDTGRPDTIYVQKAVLNGEAPEKLEVRIFQAS